MATETSHRGPARETGRGLWTRGAAPALDGTLSRVGRHLAKDGDGQWIERTQWNEHTIFERLGAVAKWATESLKTGDLVCVRSTPFQTEWEKDGETRYGQTFAVNELTLLTAKADKKPKEPEAPKGVAAGEGAANPRRSKGPQGPFRLLRDQNLRIDIRDTGCRKRVPLVRA